MATCTYNSSIKFILPTGFTMKSSVDDNGKEVKSIVYGDEEFSCLISCVDVTSDPEKYSQYNSFFQKGPEEGEDTTRYKLKGTPETVLRCRSFYILVQMYFFEATVRVSEYCILKLIAARAVSEGEETDLFFSRCFEVLKAARIDGKSLPLNGLNGETFYYEIMQNGGDDVAAELTRAYPNQELYPHYNSLRSVGGIFGVSMVVNSTGTEYEFIPLRRFLSNGDASEETKALINRIIDTDTKKYDLYDKAKEMQKLFRVNREAFDTRHDRESELEDGLLHRAYMMSGLRSFAWTLSDYCNREDISPKDVSQDKVREIVDFVAGADWLNYDGYTYCNGLCSGSDLHVYFLPTGVSQADKKALLPSKEDYARVKKMKEKFPSYREILSEVHSLDALRKDLKYIYPAVKQLWDYLAENRDHNTALLGNEADIVYAWCALALAAKEPFFSEDGPMNCYFSPPIDEEAIHAEWQPYFESVEYSPNSVYLVNKDVTLYAVWKRNTPQDTYTPASSSTYRPAPVSSNPQQSGGCYIATAVYGSYDAPEVMTLRHFRDNTLQNTALGRLFIRVYYKLSPPIAEKLKHAKRINSFVRSILDRWVNHLNKKSQ